MFRRTTEHQQRVKGMSRNRCSQWTISLAKHSCYGFWPESVSRSHYYLLLLTHLKYFLLIKCTHHLPSESIVDALTCSVVPFPIQYLGLPLSTRKVSSSQLLPLVDKLLKKLATWKASMFSRDERLALVRHVLSAMHVHILLALALSPPILKKVRRIIRDFLWHGRKDPSAGAGACLVNWAKICWPIKLGGLGVRDLQHTGISLRIWWLWLQAIDPTRSWSHLPLPHNPEVRNFFRASTRWTLGDGRSCIFWTDPWLDGQSIGLVAPSLAALIPRRRKRSCAMREGLSDRAWIQDIRGALGPAALVDYVDIWRLLQHVTLSEQTRVTI